MSSLQIPPDPCRSDPGRAEQQQMMSLAFSPSEETLVTSTDYNQLYSITTAEMTKVSAGLWLIPLSHHASLWLKSLFFMVPAFLPLASDAPYLDRGFCFSSVHVL